MLKETNQYDKYIIMASDGLWEFFTVNEILEFIGKQPSSSRDIYGHTMNAINNKLRDLQFSSTTNYERRFDTTIFINFLNS